MKITRLVGHMTPLFAVEEHYRQQTCKNIHTNG